MCEVCTLGVIVPLESWHAELIKHRFKKIQIQITACQIFYSFVANSFTICVLSEAMSCLNCTFYWNWHDFFPPVTTGYLVACNWECLCALGQKPDVKVACICTVFLRWGFAIKWEHSSTNARRLSVLPRGGKFRLVENLPKYNWQQWISRQSLLRTKPANHQVYCLPGGGGGIKLGDVRKILSLPQSVHLHVKFPALAHIAIKTIEDRTFEYGFISYLMCTTSFS